MILSTHDAYLSHLSSQFAANAENRRFWEALGTYTTELSCLLDLSLDPVRDALEALYCPTGQGDPTDPTVMLRSWLLMALCRQGSPSAWATTLIREPALAVMAGCVPGNTPGATTHRDFLHRREGVFEAKGGNSYHVLLFRKLVHMCRLLFVSLP